MEKKAILLVTFGTSVNQATAAFKKFEDKVRAAFPGIELRWAYTAKSIRGVLAKKGTVIDSPITALAKLQDEGYTRVAVQSVHILPGQEYYDLVNVVDNMSHLQGSSGKHFQTKIGKFGFHQLTLGTPLLYHQADYQEVVKCLRDIVPGDPQHALVLAGHGSGHHTFSAYGCLNDMLRQNYQNVFLGTIEGYPSLDDVKADLARKDYKQVTLIPFMNIAGDHAINDLAGDEPDSWQNELAQNYQVITILKGLLEYDNIAEIYICHIRQAYNKLDS
ncbi:anaerobic cobaltochelatase [Desulforamulus reducens MI-1]|uniref:Anaerobic cobaltochelatase n=1 Tax=Desulforamulus reducens (strain ATCC BAA-1160 / DSM 100696 / MI-1) TaxID=349161 RepID=A4J831_DESRM|nr:sirohydrochlorin cobaltochelatase [Desulforamulus reducens]ABO51234.1 anaerobic cobaltochelatase [Desulforamulus reducens MI-1]